MGTNLVDHLTYLDAYSDRPVVPFQGSPLIKMIDRSYSVFPSSGVWFGEPSHTNHTPNSILVIVTKIFDLSAV